MDKPAPFKNYFKGPLTPRLSTVKTTNLGPTAQGLEASHSISDPARSREEVLKERSTDSRSALLREG